jgi:hypothetical protein
MPDFIEVIDDALSPALCRELIAAFDASPHCQPGRTGSGVDAQKKLSLDLYLSEHSQYQSLLAKVIAATVPQAVAYFKKYHFALIAPIALSVRDPASGGPVALTHDNFAALGSDKVEQTMKALYRLGPIQAQKYEAGKGNYNYWHCEVYPQAPHNEPLHRTLLFMFYLNDVLDGGQTEFFYQEKSIQPKQGRMVIAPAYFTHTHRGAVPVSNDKYILTSWILLNRAENLYGSVCSQP